MSVKIELQGPADEVEAALVLIERFFHVLDAPPKEPAFGPQTQKVLHIHVEDLMSGFSAQPDTPSATAQPSPATPSLVDDQSEIDSLKAELSTLTEVYRYALSNMQTPQTPSTPNNPEK